MVSLFLPSTNKFLVEFTPPASAGGFFWTLYYNVVMKKLSCFWFLVSCFLFVHPALAQVASDGTWTGRCVTQGDVATIQGFECLFANILQIIVVIAGLAFFFMFISGGFKYLTSGGDEKLASASSTLTMAIIGLVGVIASWLILNFIQKFTGVNVTIFQIPGNP